MTVKYYDKINKCEVLKDDVKFGYQYFTELNIPPKMALASWKLFISDINQIKINVKKTSKEQYFEETIEVDRINSILPSDTFNRTFLTKLPYLYNDLKKEGKYRFPIFMKSVYAENNQIKVVQTAGNGKVLISFKYFPDKKIDIFISNRDLVLNQIENFCESFYGDYTLQVFLAKYEDNLHDYYVDCMEIESTKDNFFDKTLESLNLWRYIFDTIVDFKVTSVHDYKILLDRIVLGGQQFIDNK